MRGYSVGDAQRRSLAVGPERLADIARRFPVRDRPPALARISNACRERVIRSSCPALEQSWTSSEGSCGICRPRGPVAHAHHLDQVAAEDSRRREHRVGGRRLRGGRVAVAAGDVEADRLRDQPHGAPRQLEDRHRLPHLDQRRGRLNQLGRRGVLTASELAGGTLISAPDDWSAMAETLIANSLDEVPH